MRLANAEALLDAFFARAYVIEPATDDEQRRELTGGLPTAKPTTASQWNLRPTAPPAHTQRVRRNGFRQQPGQSGWAYTSQADWLAYYVVGDELVYLIR